MARRKLRNYIYTFILTHFSLYTIKKEIFINTEYDSPYFLRKLKLIHSSLRPVYRLIETFSDQSRTAKKKQHDDVRLKFL